jgi:Cu2+-exporting ATPase/Cu+-exporting ATPase
MTGCCAVKSRPERRSPGAGNFPWLRILLGAFIAGNSMVVALAINVSESTSEERFAVQLGLLIATLLVVFLVGRPLLVDAWHALRARHPSLESLFLLGCAGAMGLSVWSMLAGTGPVYFEVVSVLVVIYRIGSALKRSVQSKALLAAEALNPRNQTCERMSGQGTEVVPVASITAGQRVRCHPGGPLPVDGTILAGRAFVREAALNGETFLVPKAVGDRVLAGTELIDATLIVQATSDGQARAIDAVVAAVQQARSQPSRIERRAEAAARWFLPAVVAMALSGLAVGAATGGPSEGMFRGLAVLVVACPCAFGFATPVLMWAAQSRLARTGIVPRHGDAVEQLAGVTDVVFDKTGTLTTCEPSLTSLQVREPWRAAQVLRIADALERASGHPIGAALRSDAPRLDVAGLEVLPGVGVSGRVRWEGQTLDVVVGRRDALPFKAGDDWVPERYPIVSLVEQPDAVHQVGVTIDGSLVAIADVAEEPRPGFDALASSLRRSGLTAHVLSGDRQAGRVAALKLPNSHSGVSPLEKAKRVRQLQQQDKHVLFVGDGTNDAAAMAQSDVSLAVRSGASLAAESADLLWDGRHLSALPQAIEIAREVLARLQSNLRFAMAYNVLGMSVAAAGWLHPILAALLMLGSSLFVTLRGLAGMNVPLCVERLPTPGLEPTPAPADGLEPSATSEALPITPACCRRTASAGA